MVDREAELRQLTWVLHLILAAETASVNSRRDQVISSCEDKPPLGPVQERITLYIVCIHTAPYTYTNTHIHTDSTREERENAWGIKQSAHLKKGAESSRGEALFVT